MAKPKLSFGPDWEKQVLVPKARKARAGKKYGKGRHPGKAVRVTVPEYKPEWAAQYMALELLELLK